MNVQLFQILNNVVDSTAIQLKKYVFRSRFLKNGQRFDTTKIALATAALMSISSIPNRGKVPRKPEKKFLDFFSSFFFGLRKSLKKKKMGIPEIDVNRIFSTALLVMRDRHARFAKVAPHFTRYACMFDIEEMLSIMEKQNSSPYNAKKCFFADLAVMATKVLEAYSLDELG